MPLPLARPDANEVVLVVGRDPLDPARWLYVAERAGDGPGCSEVMYSGEWCNDAYGMPLYEQIVRHVPKPFPVALAGLRWWDAKETLLGDDALRLSWRLPEEG